MANRIHLHIRGSDFYQCGISGPFEHTEDPENSNCKNCLKTVRLFNGEWRQHVVFAQPCSGCHEIVDGYDIGGEWWDEEGNSFLGSGCPECGHTGKRRVDIWLPIWPDGRTKPAAECRP